MNTTATTAEYAANLLADEFGIDGIAAQLLANAMVRTIENYDETDWIDGLTTETTRTAKGLDRYSYNIQTQPRAVIDMARDMDLYGELRAA